MPKPLIGTLEDARKRNTFWLQIVLGAYSLTTLIGILFALLLPVGTVFVIIMVLIFTGIPIYLIYTLYNYSREMKYAQMKTISIVMLVLSALGMLNTLSGIGAAFTTFTTFLSFLLNICTSAFCFVTLWDCYILSISDAQEGAESVVVYTPVPSV
ncbi:hypothetical protein PCE1_000792 [Barthelona sp. PCE]